MLNNSSWAHAARQNQIIPQQGNCRTLGSGPIEKSRSTTCVTPDQGWWGGYGRQLGTWWAWLAVIGGLVGFGRSLKPAGICLSETREPISGRGLVSRGDPDLADISSRWQIEINMVVLDDEWCTDTAGETSLTTWQWQLRNIDIQMVPFKVIHNWQQECNASTAENN